MNCVINLLLYSKLHLIVFHKKNGSYMRKDKSEKNLILSLSENSPFIL